jgi:hypothetical protein
VRCSVDLVRRLVYMKVSFIVFGSGGSEASTGMGSGLYVVVGCGSEIWITAYSTIKRGVLSAGGFPEMQGTILAGGSCRQRAGSTAKAVIPIVGSRWRRRFLRQSLREFR